MCGSHRGCSFGSKLSPLSAVELIKFAFYRTGVFCHFVYSATGIFSFSAQKLCIALFCCLSHDLFPLFQSQRMFQSVTTGCTHIVHADGCNRFQTRFYLGRTDSETSAATNSDYTNIIPVNERTCTQKIYCGTEILRIYLRQNSIARLTFTCTPKRQVDGQRYKTTLRHFGSVQVRTLFLDRSHRMSDNNGRIFLSLFHGLRQKQVAGYFHFILVRKRNLFYLYPITFIKIIRISLCERKTGSKHHNKYNG